MIYLLLSLIFIRPFISSLAFPYMDFLYSTVLLCVLALWVILKRLPLEKVTPMLYPITAFFLAAVVSILFSLNKITSLSLIYRYITNIIIFVLCLCLSDKDKKRVIYTIVFAGFVISILSIYQYLFGFQHILDYVARKNITRPFILDYLGRRRVFFPFVTPNTLAGFLVMLLPLALLINDKKKWFVIALIVTALSLTKSLGAFISLFLGMALYLYLRKDRPGKKFFFLAMIVIIFAFIFILRQLPGKEHTLPMFSFAKRIDYWRETLKIFRLYPLTGVGIGNFNLPSTRYAHNSYLQVSAEMGIIGLLSLIWLVSSAMRTGLNQIKRSHNKNITICLVTSSSIFLIHNLMDFTFFLPEVSLIWWVILGLAIAKD
ncbi:MAG: O-antigen ligase family protein [Candidatus Omnitrophota bacterium]